MVIALAAIPPTVSASPYALSRHLDGRIAAATLAAGALATAVSGEDALTAAEVAGLSKGDVNWFDRSATGRYSPLAATASDALMAACALAPLALWRAPALREDWQVLGVMYLETFFLANWVPDISKGAVDRVRPYVYNSEAPLKDKLEDSGARRSFPSGHTTMAFATAVFSVTVLGDYYPEARWASWTGKGLLRAAAGVGGLRYAAGAHYPTDVLVGAAVGSAIGYLVPRLHRRDGDGRLALGPAPGVVGPGLSLNWAL